MTDDHRLVIFDVDGTLIDSQHHILAAATAAFEAAGREVPSREAVLSIVGLSLPEAMAALVPGLSLEEARVLAEHYRDSYDLRPPPDHAPLYPGARAALERLAGASDTLMGVATGKGRRGLGQVFDAHKLHDFFVTVQTSDDHPSKPHPSMLLAALSESGCAAERAVMIGDTEYDMEMGRAAGIATIGVAWGYHPRERLEAAGADLIIDGFEALDAALATLRTRA